MANKLPLKTLLLAICLLLQVNLLAQDTKTVHVETKGTLSSLISITEQGQIKELIITGILNPYDFSFIRGMSNLEYLNIEEVQIMGDNNAYNNSLYYIATACHLYNCTGLKSVVLPKTLTMIGHLAFSGCSSLQSIQIPNIVTSVGNAAFQNCTNLTKIEFGNSVVDVASNAFSGCSAITHIILGNSIPSFLDTWKKSTLQNITVNAGNNIYSSQNGILYNKAKTEIVYCPLSCTGTITIPTSIVSIPINTFSRRTKITSITISEGCIEIGNNAFEKCTQLSQINLPSSLVSIGDNAFNGCTLLSTSLPNGINSIGNSAFKSCGFTSANIPSSVSSIGNEVFSGNTMLKQIAIADAEQTLTTGTNVFTNCPLEYIYLGRDYTTVNIFNNMATLESVELGKNVSLLTSSSFSSCFNLKKIVYNNDEPLVPFACFPYIKELHIPTKGLVNYFSLEGWKDVEYIYGQEDEQQYFALYTACVGSPLVSVNDKTDTVVVIAKDKNVKIQALGTLNSKDKLYFNGEDISSKLPLSTTMTRKCSLLEFCGSSEYQYKVEASGNLLQQIGNISVLPNIEYLSLIGDLNGTDLRIIRQMDNLKMLDLRNAKFVSGGVTYYDNFTTEDKTVPMYAFYQLPALSVIYMPDDATQIGSYACYGCDQLEFCKIGDTSIKISMYAFANCRKLGYVDIGEKNRTIDNNAFQNCENLSTVIFNNECNAINSYVFQNCKGLSMIKLPKKLTKVGDNAFADCSGLKTVYFQENVTSLGNSSFADCDKLENIYSYNTTPPSLPASTFKNVNRNLCTLNVSTDAYTNYYLANYWNEFLNIGSFQLYSLTYMLDGEVYIVEKYRENDVINPLETLEKDGFIFSGWSEIPSSMPTNDVIVKGYFTIISSINTIYKENISIQSILNGIAIETKETILISIFNTSGQKVYESVVSGYEEIYLNKGMYIVRANNESQKVIVR